VIYFLTMVGASAIVMAVLACIDVYPNVYNWYYGIEVPEGHREPITPPPLEEKKEENDMPEGQQHLHSSLLGEGYQHEKQIEGHEQENI